MGGNYRCMAWSFEDAVDHFDRKDPRMADLLRRYGPMEFRLHEDHFEVLVGSILSQQISTRAAESIRRRLSEGLGGRVTPAAILSAGESGLRQYGVSPQKCGYLSDLSSHFLSSPERFGNLERLSDEEVERELVAVRGIGPWTAQMFLIFTLGRPDIFAPDDLGLRNAMTALYRWRAAPDRKKLVRTAARWSPYRTVASRYLWISLSGPAGGNTGEG